MRIYNKSNGLAISLAVAFIAINALLSLLGQNYLMIYLIFGAVACLAMALIFSDLNSRSTAGLNIVSAAIFVCFLIFAVLKIIEIVR